MPGPWFYDLIYRFGAPWELGVRTELKDLVESGRLHPEAGDTAIDLGCGTGANTVFLAQQGWETTGVDFSPVATRKAEARAREEGVTNIRFVNGDLTAVSIEGAEGPFDFLLDYGTLDDLQGASRRRMAELMTRIAAPGAGCLLYCFYARLDELPRINFKGASKIAPGIEPGELERLFGSEWQVEHLEEFANERKEAVFLMTRTARTPAP